MTFIPAHPTELVAEALNRFGPDLSGAEKFIKNTISDMEILGHIKRVPWVVHSIVDRRGALHFIVMPETLVDRITKYSENEGEHVFFDEDAQITTRSSNPFVGVTEHAKAVEQHLNKHVRN